MNTITINRREVARLKELFDMFPENGEYATVVLSQHSESGIGTILTGTFEIFYKDIEGEFKVTITDESSW